MGARRGTLPKWATGCKGKQTLGKAEPDASVPAQKCPPQRGALAQMYLPGCKRIRAFPIGLGVLDSTMASCCAALTNRDWPASYHQLPPTRGKQRRQLHIPPQKSAKTQSDLHSTQHDSSTAQCSWYGTLALSSRKPGRFADGPANAQTFWGSSRNSPFAITGYLQSQSPRSLLPPGHLCDNPAPLHALIESHALPTAGGWGQSHVEACLRKNGILADLWTLEI